MKWSESISLSPRGFPGLIYSALWGDFSQTACYAVYNNSSDTCRSVHNTVDYVPYSYQMVSGFFNVPCYLISNKGYEMGPPFTVLIQEALKV